MIKFSIVLIVKNEANTLPKLFESLAEFKKKGGEVCVLDTGSTDNTVKIAKKWGCKVKEVKDKFTTTIDYKTAREINDKFVVPGEPDVVKPNSKLFNFAAARNYISSLAKNDMIATLDADEVYTKFDINKINKLIDEGWEKFEYQFIYAHHPDSRPAVKFMQSKFFDRRKSQWSGVVHEVLVGDAKTIYVDESIILLEHFQEPAKDHRNNYVVGLALDCFQNITKDRQSHYLARELMYTKRYKSAIKEFERHITMGGWAAERAQSMIYIGDSYGQLNQPDKQLQWYHQAFDTDSKRREALIKLAQFMRFNNNPQAAAAYSAAALQIPWSDYYANDRLHYENIPHEILYWARGWMGDIAGAQEHILKALSYQPYHIDYLRDTKYYFEYYDRGIQGWMTFPELTWLYNTAKTMNTIVEVGSWKGRSTHALLSGCKGTVYAVDTWKGSKDINDETNKLAKEENVFAAFRENTKGFDNLQIIKKTSIEAAKEFADNSIDMVFIDAGHDYKSVMADIEAWTPKAKRIICGHDYVHTWPDVVKAVNNKFSAPSVTGSIWQVNLSKDLIPKNIFTIWLGDKPPEYITRCIESQKLPGYTHKLITLSDIPTDIPYVNAAIKAKKWVKAADLLRIYYLIKEGGIYLDADVQILPGKTFDDLLSNKLFAAKEENGFIANSVIGSVPSHVSLVDYFNRLTSSDFKGNDDRIFESGMELFNEIIQSDSSATVLDKTYFLPYNHQTGVINVTNKTIAFHHFAKTWLKSKDILPTVSIIIPQLGRPEGLQRCLESINQLYYPKHLIETIIIKGTQTVPTKMAMGLKKAKGSVICYAANDMAFLPDSLYNAISESIELKKGLVSFNEGDLLEDEGNICTHFIIQKSLIKRIGGEIFSKSMRHVGVDNLLWKKCSKLHQAHHSLAAKIIHYHFSKGYPMDEIYKIGWKNVEADRKILAKELRNI